MAFTFFNNFAKSGVQSGSYDKNGWFKSLNKHESNDLSVSVLANGSNVGCCASCGAGLYLWIKVLRLMLHK